MSYLCDGFTLALLGAAISLFSFWAGHRTALWRDIRKERNVVADLLRKQLKAMVSSPSPYIAVSSDALHVLERTTLGWRRRRVRLLVKAYQAAADQQRVHDAVGQSFFSDPQRVAQAAKALEKECQHQ